jgi:hypothetical protein
MFKCLTSSWLTQTNPQRFWVQLDRKVSSILMRTLCPASLTFRERLARAIPAKDVGAPGVPLDWSRLAAAETTEALAEEAASKVEINSGGYVAVDGRWFIFLYFSIYFYDFPVSSGMIGVMNPKGSIDPVFTMGIGGGMPIPDQRWMLSIGEGAFESNGCINCLC